jgi:hypothetical protein
MAGRRSSGDWLVLEEMLERGDPAFALALRSFHDAEVLASFAARWFKDSRAASRRLLLDYLDQPPNAFRHEPLVKRLFKQAESAGDDELMARFLVLFDRSIRREEHRRRHYEFRTLKTAAEAQALLAAWQSMGFDHVGSWQDGQGRVHVHGVWSEPILRSQPGTEMPRDRPKYRSPRTGERLSDLETDRAFWLRKSLDGEALPARIRERVERLRLFSSATRQYLRRRAWRYFRRLGRNDPGRYVRAVAQALARYRDEDVPDGLALIDNWGLIHILFHRSPVLVARPAGWVPAEGRTLSELTPAPIYEPLWEQEPRAIVDVLLAARCRPVRQWAIAMIRRHEAARATIRLEELLDLLGRDDPDVVALAAEWLREAKGLDAVDAGRWLALVETVNPAALAVIAELMRRHVDARELTLEQIVCLAASRPVPLARLGLEWLQTTELHDEAGCRTVLSLAEAECASVRPEIARFVCGRLAAWSRFEPDWMLELMDSRHADVRTEAIAWFRGEPRACENVALWRRLLESPYDDVRVALVADLESRVKGRDMDRLASLELDPEALRLLWASVLLSIHRGSRAKPTVVRQLVRRIERRPEETASLLPLLAVALRSSRGPERRAGLAGIAGLVARRAEAAALVSASFPELKLR